jgi:hypothetical protein
MTNVLNFPISDSVGAALEKILAEYDRRKDTVALAFQLANLSDEKLAATLAEATLADVSSLIWFLDADAEAFDGLVTLLMDVLARVQAALRTTRRGHDHG